MKSIINLILAYYNDYLEYANIITSIAIDEDIGIFICSQLPTEHLPIILEGTGLNINCEDSEDENFENWVTDLNEYSGNEIIWHNTPELNVLCKGDINKILDIANKIKILLDDTITHVSFSADVVHLYIKDNREKVYEVFGINSVDPTKFIDYNGVHISIIEK